MRAVLVKSFPLTPVNTREALRYAGCRGESEQMLALLKSCCDELGDTPGRVCFAELPVAIQGDIVTLGELSVCSQSLARHLGECGRAVIFAATVGIGIDRLIARYSVTSPARAVMFQALGAERIEALCDVFCDELREKAGELANRFSPGYGDLPLAFQTEMFRALDCSRHIGVSLNGSLLMSPSKSVTAIVGIKGV